MRRRNGRPLLFLLIFIAAVILVLVGIHLWETKYYAVEETYYEDGRYDGGEETLYYDGTEYIKKDLETVLVIGIDKYEQEETEGTLNTEQADFLILLLLDDENEKFTAIPINRDTMATVSKLGLDGRSVGETTEQLALAHTYGSGGTDSCRNTVNAVSGFLYGMDIDYYISFSMDAVAIANDEVGGVTLTLMDDFSDIDPEMKEGEEVTLLGDQALLYVRARQSLEDSRNIHRMERQAQYLSALKEAYVSAGLSDTEVTDLMLKINEYMVSDCSASKLSDLYDRLVGYEFAGYRDIPGESVKGEENMEFYADDAALKELVIEEFYSAKE